MSKWINFRNLPIELMHSQVLFKLGYKLGGFVGLEETWSCSVDLKMLVDLDINLTKLSNIDFITANVKYSIKPEFYIGPV